MTALSQEEAAQWIAAEMVQYRMARRTADHAAAWRALERAHILAQPYFAPHLRSHGHMLAFALTLRDWREAAGQLLRLLLVPAGSLTGRLPIGNTGRARISAFKPMPMPGDLAALLSSSDKPAQH